MASVPFCLLLDVHLVDKSLSRRPLQVVHVVSVAIFQGVIDTVVLRDTARAMAVQNPELSRSDCRATVGKACSQSLLILGETIGPATGAHAESGIRKFLAGNVVSPITPPALSSNNADIVKFTWQCQLCTSARQNETYLLQWTTLHQ